MISLLKEVLVALLPVFAVAAFVVMVYWFFLSPKILYYLLIASFPYLTGIDLSHLAPVTLVITPAKFFGLLGFVGAVLYAWGHGSIFFTVSLQVVLTFLLLLAHFASFMVNGQGNDQWLPNLISHLMFLLMAAYWTVNAKEMGRARLWFAGALLLSAAYSWITGTWPHEGVEVPIEQARFSGTMLNANRAAQFTAVAAAYAFGLALVAKDRWRRGLGIAAFLGLSYMVLMTGSRAGFLMLVTLGVGLLLLAQRVLRTRWLVLGMTVGLVALVVWFAPSVFEKRILSPLETAPGSRLSRSDQSIASRLFQYELAVDLFKENPFTGVGPGNFERIFLSKELYARPVHNIYLTVLMDCGLVGLLAYLMLVLVTGLQLFNASRRAHDPELRVHCYTDLIVLIGLMVYGLTGTGPLEKPIFLTIALSINVAMMVRQEGAGRKEAPGAGLQVERS